MSLGEKAGYYCKSLGKSCAEGILLAANEEYGLGLTQDEVQLFAGFRTGPGGALAGAVGVLSRLYRRRADLKELCADFSALYERESASSAADGSAAAELAARLLEQYISRLEEPSAAPREEPTDAPLRPEDIKRVKGLGFLQHKGTNKFNGRVITRNGRITADEAQAITDAARHYGDGHLMMTTRLTIEVSGIDYGDIDAFRADLAEAGLETGGTGAKVRPVVSCKGTTCQYGLYDTYALSEEIHQRFYKGYRDVALPHKFKIAVGGCPNNCVKPNLNDLGIVGARVPGYDPEKCRGCKKCQLEAACPVHAAQLKNGKLFIDPALCNNCGRCIQKCPFHCNDEGTSGWKVYVGGRWGKRVAHGQMLRKVFTDREELLDVVEKAILLFRSQGQPGERFADTIQRIGFDRAQELLLGEELLRQKDDILRAR